MPTQGKKSLTGAQAKRTIGVARQFLGERPNMPSEAAVARAELVRRLEEADADAIELAVDRVDAAREKAQAFLDAMSEVMTTDTAKDLKIRLRTANQHAEALIAEAQSFLAGDIPATATAPAPAEQNLSPMPEPVALPSEPAPPPAPADEGMLDSEAMPKGGKEDEMIVDLAATFPAIGKEIRALSPTSESVRDGIDRLRLLLQEVLDAGESASPEDKPIYAQMAEFLRKGLIPLYQKIQSALEKAEKDPEKYGKNARSLGALRQDIGSAYVCANTYEERWMKEVADRGISFLDEALRAHITTEPEPAAPVEGGAPADAVVEEPVEKSLRPWNAVRVDVEHVLGSVAPETVGDVAMQMRALAEEVDDSAMEKVLNTIALFYEKNVPQALRALRRHGADPAAVEAQYLERPAVAEKYRGVKKDIFDRAFEKARELFASAAAQVQAEREERAKKDAPPAPKEPPKAPLSAAEPVEEEERKIPEEKKEAILAWMLRLTSKGKLVTHPLDSSKFLYASREGGDPYPWRELFPLFNERYPAYVRKEVLKGRDFPDHIRNFLEDIGRAAVTELMYAWFKRKLAEQAADEKKSLPPPAPPAEPVRQVDTEVLEKKIAQARDFLRPVLTIGMCVMQEGDDGELQQFFVPDGREPIPLDTYLAMGYEQSEGESGPDTLGDDAWDDLVRELFRERWQAQLSRSPVRPSSLTVGSPMPRRVTVPLSSPPVDVTMYPNIPASESLSPVSLSPGSFPPPPSYSTEDLSAPAGYASVPPVESDADRRETARREFIEALYRLALDGNGVFKRLAKDQMAYIPAKSGEVITEFTNFVRHMDDDYYARYGGRQLLWEFSPLTERDAFEIARQWWEEQRAAVLLPPDLHLRPPVPAVSAPESEPDREIEEDADAFVDSFVAENKESKKRAGSIIKEKGVKASLTRLLKLFTQHLALMAALGGVGVSVGGGFLVRERQERQAAERVTDSPTTPTPSPSERMSIRAGSGRRGDVVVVPAVEPAAFVDVVPKAESAPETVAPARVEQPAQAPAPAAEAPTPVAQAVTEVAVAPTAAPPTEEARRELPPLVQALDVRVSKEETAPAPKLKSSSISGQFMEQIRTHMDDAKEWAKDLGMRPLADGASKQAKDRWVQRFAGRLVQKFDLYNVKKNTQWVIAKAGPQFVLDFENRDYIPSGVEKGNTLRQAPIRAEATIQAPVPAGETSAGGREKPLVSTTSTPSSSAEERPAGGTMTPDAIVDELPEETPAIKVSPTGERGSAAEPGVAPAAESDASGAKTATTATTTATPERAEKKKPEAITPLEANTAQPPTSGEKLETSMVPVVLERIERAGVALEFGYDEKKQISSVGAPTYRWRSDAERRAAADALVRKGALDDAARHALPGVRVGSPTFSAFNQKFMAETQGPLVEISLYQRALDALAISAQAGDQKKADYLVHVLDHAMDDLAAKYEGAYGNVFTFSVDEPSVE